MDIKAVAGALSGVALTIAGAATALFLTVGQGEPAPAPQSTEIVTEYVDQYGNPVDLTTPTVSPATGEELVSATAYEDHDEYEEEYEDDHENEGEYEDDHEYEEAEYYEHGYEEHDEHEDEDEYEEDDDD